ncbi:MAG: hypothetical protein ACNFW9_04620 [Candidatus Kerfeldbacteria bacterium]
MFEAFTIVVLVAIVIGFIIRCNTLKKDLQQSQDDLHASNEISDTYRNFVMVVSDAVKGNKPYNYLDALRTCDIDNACDVTSMINFIYAINSATKTLQEAESGCSAGSVESKAAHVRKMVEEANTLALMVNETLCINSDQMLIDLGRFEHDGNVSEVTKSVGYANDTLREIFSQFQKLNVQMDLLGVSRAEVGIDSDTPLANFLDTARTIADTDVPEADMDSTDNVSDGDKDTNPEE